MSDGKGLKSPSLTKPNPLLKYTLRGQAEALEKMAVESTPLLGSFCLKGQSTVLAAPPNAGKTLITIASIIDAIRAERIKGDDVTYVNADDSTQGVADKLRVLEEYGAHMIAEGYQGFRAVLLIPILEKMANEQLARGKLVILDTLKKFAQPMSKVEASQFTAALRRFVLSGGTVLSLSHTNKHTDAKMNNVFAGVSDLIDDVDNFYIIDVKTIPDGERIAVFTNRKRRGNNPDTLAYAYSTAPDMSYVERLSSVRETDEYDKFSETQHPGKMSDGDILLSLAAGIKHWPDVGKMELIRQVAQIVDAPKHRVARLLEAHAGDDPEVHHWRYLVKARGLHVFELLRPLPAPG